MRYSKSWTEALREVQEQVGVRKVDFADGVTPDIEPDIEEAKIPEGLSKEGAAEFMAAASAAKKAGKKTFKFGDKEYPVTIKVDIPTSKKEETDLEEKMFSGKGEFEVKYASSKKGPIKVSKFNTLKDAQKFLAQVKGEGMNGIISKGGKPVKEDEDLEKVAKELEKASKMHLGQSKRVQKHLDKMNKMKEDHHEKDANGEPIPHDDEEDTSEAYTMHKGMKVKNVPRSAGKDAKKDNEARRAAQRKRLGLEDVEIDEKKGMLPRPGAGAYKTPEQRKKDAEVKKRLKMFKSLRKKEEVDESLALQMKMAADDIETYAKKHGGIDKKDMMKVASMLKKGDKKGALKYAKNLDTDPRDYLLKSMGEEVEIDEKKSDYEDQIKAFLAKGGTIQKGNRLNKQKIDKVTKGFLKKYGVMKKKEADLDAKDREELEKMMGEESINEATGNEIKKYMKSKWNTDVKASKVGTGRSMVVKGKIPNDFRDHVAKQFYPDAKILDKKNIDFGNIRPNYVSLRVGMWDELLKEEVELDEAPEKFVVVDTSDDSPILDAVYAIYDTKRQAIAGAKKADKELRKSYGHNYVSVRIMKTNKNQKVGKRYKGDTYDDLVRIREEVELDEARKSDYELYHKTFSGAMQHAYAHAKKKGYTVDPDEIDNKVATGPKKPSAGKTNRYILGTDKKQKLHVQVANLDNKRFELNMYIEETDTDEALSLTQRKKKARQMRILSKKASTQRKKEMNKKRAMPLDKALQKGQKQARKMVMQKVAGKGKNIANLSPVEKERLETKTDSRISKMGPKYKNLAKRFAKQIVKKHNQAKADAKKKES
mgnify:CR=1 FL=1